MTKQIHLSINIEGILKVFKKKKIDIFTHDDGLPMSDKQARKHLAECLVKGWTVLPASPLCVGFDYTGGGCPGHEVAVDKAGFGL
jgi:hypothetical protein